MEVLAEEDFVSLVFLEDLIVFFLLADSVIAAHNVADAGRLVLLHRLHRQ